MKIFYSEEHRRHSPAFEVFDGGMREPYFESPGRMDEILSALRKTAWAEITEPADFGLDPILAVHDPDYIRFLASAWDEWRAGASGTDRGSDHSALLPATFALRRMAREPKSLLGRTGYHIMDLSAPIVEGTYAAAIASANCALTAAQAIASGEQTAFALCRPPGHHAGKDFAAGYCYINSAAVAASWLSGRGRVAVLDIDYHAGNGTQDIFYERADVFTVSMHGDPNYEYPHYAGYEDETGVGIGLGYHRNFPLLEGTDDASYLAVLNKALELITAYRPLFIVVSAGMDIYDGDPLGSFKITHSGISEIGKRIARLKLPTMVVMEGGYNMAALGENIRSFLEAFSK